MCSFLWRSYGLSTLLFPSWHEAHDTESVAALTALGTHHAVHYEACPKVFFVASSLAAGALAWGAASRRRLGSDRKFKPSSFSRDLTSAFVLLQTSWAYLSDKHSSCHVAPPRS